MADRRDWNQVLQDMENDRDRLLREGRPDPEALAQAPLLEPWMEIRLAMPGWDGASIQGVDVERILVGRVKGHPNLREGATTATTPLSLVDFESGWARTVSRFYRLGRPATAEERAAFEEKARAYAASLGRVAVIVVIAEDGAAGPNLH